MTLSQAEFTFVSTLVRREASIVLAPGKEYLVEARLIPVARAVGAASVTEFLAELQRRPNPANQRKIIDALTTNETSWFRDREPFNALTDVVLPELIKARATVPQAPALVGGQLQRPGGLQPGHHCCRRTCRRAGRTRSWAPTSPPRWSSGPKRPSTARSR